MEIDDFEGGGKDHCNFWKSFDKLIHPNQKWENIHDKTLITIISIYMIKELHTKQGLNYNYICLFNDGELADNEILVFVENTETKKPHFLIFEDLMQNWISFDAVENE